MTNISDQVEYSFNHESSSVSRVTGATLALEVSVDSSDAFSGDDRGRMHAGEDIPWILKYVAGNKEEALLCLLFSIAVGLCFILLAIMCCLCCRWRRAKSKGSFTVAKPNNEGGGRVSAHTSGGNKETEGLLNQGMVHSSSAGRTYSSPRLIRAEYARGMNSSSGGLTPSSVSNANVVGLYLSQAPKSRWSRASDATVWPQPPNSLGNTLDGDASAVSTIARTLPINERPPQMTLPGRATTPNSTLSPPLVTLFSQNIQTMSPHFQVQSSFAPVCSPTDYLFNRQSVLTDPRSAANASCKVARPLTTNSTNDSVLRKSPNDENVAQRKAFSYQGAMGMVSTPYQSQHQSYMGPSHPMSPPILPAPASSPWPTRNSQIILDHQDMPNVSTANGCN